MEAPVVAQRTCGTCTACCEGWLSGAAYNYPFAPGMPCQFKGDGCCSIYDQRPDNPCKSYRCEWLRNPQIPAWMQPNLVGVILTTRSSDDVFFLDASECGKPMSSRVLKWLFIYHCITGYPIRVQIEGGHTIFADPGTLTKITGLAITKHREPRMPHPVIPIAAAAAEESPGSATPAAAPAASSEPSQGA